MKKPKRKYLLKLWGKVIMARDKNICQFCGNKNANNPHHIIPKSRAGSLIFDLLNGICLCTNCHIFGKDSAHVNAEYFNEWLRQNWFKDGRPVKDEEGKVHWKSDIFEKMEIQSRLPYKFDAWAVKLFLDEEMKQLEARI